MQYFFAVSDLFLAVRKSKGLTQVAMAKLLEISRSRLSIIESGKYNDDTNWAIVNRFSHVNKVSLRSFQIGYIDGPTTEIKNALPNSYGINGTFSSKITLYFLDAINSLLEINIYETLQINRSYLCFSELKIAKSLFVLLEGNYPKEFKGATSIVTSKIKLYDTLSIDKPDIGPFKGFKVIQVSEDSYLVKYNDAVISGDRSTKALLEILHLDISIRYGELLNHKLIKNYNQYQLAINV
jgi:DNA-binding XRE family transcriptional regulator